MEARRGLEEKIAVLEAAVAEQQSEITSALSGPDPDLSAASVLVQASSSVLNYVFESGDTDDDGAIMDAIIARSSLINTTASIALLAQDADEAESAAVSLDSLSTYSTSLPVTDQTNPNRALILFVWRISIWGPKKKELIEVIRDLFQIFT